MTKAPSGLGGFMLHRTMFGRSHSAALPSVRGAAGSGVNGAADGWASAGQPLLSLVPSDSCPVCCPWGFWGQRAALLTGTLCRQSLLNSETVCSSKQYAFPNVGSQFFFQVCLFADWMVACMSVLPPPCAPTTQAQLSLCVRTEDGKETRLRSECHC